MGVAYRGSALYVISGSFFMEAAGFGESWTTSQLLPWMSGTVKNNDATVYMKELVSNFMFDAAEFFIVDSINGVMAPIGIPSTTCDPSKAYSIPSAAPVTATTVKVGSSTFTFGTAV